MKKQVRIWLWTGVFMVLVQVMLGGITRLTGSGLSITQWDLITGSVPPLNTSQWNEKFDEYKKIPQYRLVNENMTLQQFKGIFFWEYLHRNWARLTGIVFLIPFIYFLIRKKLTRSWKIKLWILFVLGGLQGLMGWIMVSSGLTDRPWVSPYDLTIHLLLALVVYVYLLWLIFSMHENDIEEHHPISHKTMQWIIAVIGIQILFGGFMAGTHAGLQYNTYPLMNGKIIPGGLNNGQGFPGTIFDNTTAINFIHRTLGTLLLFFIFIYFWWNRKYCSRRLEKLNIALLILIAVQFILGIATLLTGSGGINIYLGAAHQMGACILLGIAVAILFYSKSRKAILSITN